MLFRGNPSNNSIYSPQAYSDLVVAGRAVGGLQAMIGLFNIHRTESIQEGGKVGLVCSRSGADLFRAHLLF